MNETGEEKKWICGACQIPLQAKTVTVTYMGGTFPVELFTCPQCGMVFIPESLAYGKMLEVEKTLEDK